MKPSDKPEFVRILAGLAAIKPGNAGGLTPEALDLWWASMSPKWQLAEFKAAAAHLVTAVQFMPSPYDFEQLRRAGELTAGEAWAKALSASRDWCTPGKLPVGRLARAAQAVGGFKAIAFANVERELPHIQRRFLEAYEELSDVEPVREALPSLVTPMLGSVREQKGQLLPVLP